MIKNLFTPAMVAATTLAMSAAFSAPAFANEQQKADEDSSPESWRLSTGLNYSKGSYGEIDDTKVVSAPIGLKYTKGNFSIRVSVPYVRVDGPGSLIQTPEGSGSGSNSGSGRSGNSGHGSSNSGSGNSGSGGVEIDDSTGVPVSSKRSGFGDVVISATYSFDLGSDFYIDATGKVKVPTASTAKRLGTGEVDVTTGLDFVKSVGPATFYIHGRRKFAGKPTGSLIRSTWGAGGGASIKAGKAITLGADYDWQEATFAGNPANSDVTAWASARLNSKMNLSIFGSTGLNNNSADFAGGIGLSIKLN